MQLLIHNTWLPMIVSCCLIWADGVSATSYADPQRHDVFSPNQMFVLDVDPQTNTLTVYFTNNRSHPVWSFSRPIWHEPYFLSDDGKTVATLHWKHIQENDLAIEHCVEFWQAGAVVQAHGFSQLCPNPAKTQYVGIGPIGSFWRTWYTSAEQNGSTLTVKTTGWHRYSFDMNTGQVIESNLLLSNVRYKPACWIAALVFSIASAWLFWKIRRIRSLTAKIRCQQV